MTTLAPWHSVQKIADTAPNNQPAVWTDGTQTVIAWPADPDQRGINLSNGTNTPVLLPFGMVQQVTLYPADAGLLHVLWLDQTHPDQPHLASALITTDGKIQRGANAVNAQPTAHYAAVMLSNGNVLTLWIETGQHSPLFAQLLDGADRPHPAVRLSSDASYPSGMVDSNGRLHLVWLENTGGQTWTIRYLSFDSGKLPDADNPSSVPIGVIKVDGNQALEDFALGVDAMNVYCLWETITLDATGQPIGTLAGFTFPIGNDNAVAPINVDALNGHNLRWLSVPIRVLPTLTVGLTGTTGSNDNPVAVSITPNGATLQPVFDHPSGVTSRTALAADSNGALSLVWTGLRSDGTASVYDASTGTR